MSARAAARRTIRHRLRSFLPVRFDEAVERGGGGPVVTTFGLQRSGQHLVIDWMCRGFVETLHLNNCRFYPDGWSLVLSPVTGRRVVYSARGIDDSGPQGRPAYKPSLPAPSRRHVVYSLENQSPSQRDVKKLLARFEGRRVLILRDPANWLASSLRHGLQTREALRDNVSVLKDYLRLAPSDDTSSWSGYLAINFNRFVEDPAYRRSLCERLDLASFERAEQALHHTPDFGGGSSFKGGAAKTDNVRNRFLEYSDDAFFQSVMHDSELLRLARPFFGTLPYLDERAAG